MIDKLTIIITSLGRTGTKFFSLLFSEIIANSTSLHEPDSLLIGLGHYGVKEVVDQIKMARISNMIRKTFGNWRLTEISDGRFRGSVAYPDAVDAVLNQRTDFIDSQPGKVYIESNVGFYGLIDVLGAVFSNHRVAYMVRDGREWIRSEMNWGEMYGKGKVRSLVAHTWPVPSPDSNYHKQWATMSRFAKLCWAWSALNEYAVSTLDTNKAARLYRFGDIFKSEEREANMQALVNHLTNLPEVRLFESKPLSEWIEQPVHKSKKRFPTWEQWSGQQKEQFHTIRGSLMAQLGYKYD